MERSRKARRQQGGQSAPISSRRQRRQEQPSFKAPPESGKRTSAAAGAARGRGRRWRRILETICLFIALGVFLFSGYQLLNISGEYHAAEQEYEELEVLAPTPLPEASSDERQIDFSALSQKNSDVVAWITIPDTKVDYPVVQGRDNSYYISHTFQKKANSSGAIFMDYKNAGDFSDRNTVLYGHHMKNGSMFAALMQYKKADFFRAHRTFYLYTPATVYEATVFSVYVAEPTGEQTTMKFASDEAFLRFADVLKRKSMTATDTVIVPTDRIITLSTCSYEFSDARTIVHAVLKQVQPLVED